MEHHADEDPLLQIAKAMVDEMLRRVNEGTLDGDDYDELVGKVREIVEFFDLGEEFVSFVNTKGVPQWD